MCFSPYLGIGCPGRGGSPKGLVHNLLMVFFILESSKIEVSETYFFDIVTTQHDHPSDLQHLSGRIYVFFTLFGYWVSEGSQGIGTQPTYTIFLRVHLKNQSVLSNNIHGHCVNPVHLVMHTRVTKKKGKGVVCNTAIVVTSRQTLGFTGLVRN